MDSACGRYASLQWNEQHEYKYSFLSFVSLAIVLWSQNKSARACLWYIQDIRVQIFKCVEWRVAVMRHGHGSTALSHSFPVGLLLIDERCGKQAEGKQVSKGGEETVRRERIKQA